MTQAVAEKKVRGPYKKKEKEAVNAPAPTSTTEALVSYDPFNSHIQVGNSVKDLIASLPKLNNEELKSLFINTVDAERAMFVVRGATAYELYKRALKEGAEFSKAKGAGVDSLLNSIAAEVGIDGKTLYTDFKVFEEFGGWLTEQLTTAPETIMPREYYVLAMKTTNMAIEPPSEVLRYFQEQREVTGGYYTDHARRDTKLFNEGKSVEEVQLLDAEFRMEKVAEKGKKKAPKKVAEKETMLKIVASEQNINWYRQIIEKYSSFNAFYERKCMEEFGLPEEDK